MPAKPAPQDQRPLLPAAQRKPARAAKKYRADEPKRAPKKRGLAWLSAIALIAAGIAVCAATSGLGLPFGLGLIGLGMGIALREESFWVKNKRLKATLKWLSYGFFAAALAAFTVGMVNLVAALVAAKHAAAAAASSSASNAAAGAASAANLSSGTIQILKIAAYVAAGIVGLYVAAKLGVFQGLKNLAIRVKHGLSSKAPARQERSHDESLRPQARPAPTVYPQASPPAVASRPVEFPGQRSASPAHQGMFAPQGSGARPRPRPRLYPSLDDNFQAADAVGSHHLSLPTRLPPPPPGSRYVPY